MSLRRRASVRIDVASVEYKSGPIPPTVNPNRFFINTHLRFLFNHVVCFCCVFVAAGSSLEELASNVDDAESALEESILHQSNLLTVAPFGMDLDVHSNRSSLAVAVRIQISGRRCFYSTKRPPHLSLCLCFMDAE